VRRLSIPDETSRHEEGSPRPADEPLERRAAFAQWSRHERSAVLLEQVEDRVPRGGGAGDGASLKELKARDALFVQGDELAVDHEVAVAEGLHGFDDVGKPAGEVLEHPRPDLHLAALATGDRSYPVV